MLSSPCKSDDNLSLLAFGLSNPSSPRLTSPITTPLSMRNMDQSSPILRIAFSDTDVSSNFSSPAKLKIFHVSVPFLVFPHSFGHTVCLYETG